jgi:molybdate transport system substrate-binding protein
VLPKDWRAKALRDLLIALLLLVLSPAIRAEPLRIAVASNFTQTLQKLSESFQLAHAVDVQISSASSGKLSAQIQHGAPFDLFLSADAEKPEYLIQKALADERSLRTYALGVLVLWQPGKDGAAAELALRSGRYKKLALANARIAPYGFAAEQVLKALHVERDSSWVQGENIAQTFQYLHSGNADLGFVALAQLKSRNLESEAWLVPERYYHAIHQQAVVLTNAKHAQMAYTFLEFLASQEAQQIISSDGYKLPETIQ